MNIIHSGLEHITVAKQTNPTLLIHQIFNAVNHQENKNRVEYISLWQVISKLQKLCIGRKMHDILTC